MFIKSKIPEPGTVNPLLLFQMLRSAEDSETVPAPDSAIELGSPPVHTTIPGPQSPPAESER